MCRPVLTGFFPHFRLHEEQKGMDILAIYCAVDSEGKNKQWREVNLF